MADHVAVGGATCHGQRVGLGELRERGGGRGGGGGGGGRGAQVHYRDNKEKIEAENIRNGKTKGQKPTEKRIKIK